MLGRRRGATQQAALSPREITVLADKSLPYEVVQKVMATCTAAAYGQVLARRAREAGPAAAQLSAL